jgi:hypothetical protein
MQWTTPIDLYCERIDSSFWAEPVNALTNAAFLIAAAVAFAQWRRTARDPFVLALIAVIALIGLGSFAFHTLATRGAVLLDVIPIAVFVYGYFFLALRRFLNLALLPAVGLLLAYIAFSYAVDWALPRGFLNGSGGYLPALAAMLVIGWLLRAQKEGRAILVAVVVFVVSLTFRTIDVAVCGAFPLGTHFIWHTLNALLLYLLIRTAMNNR